MGNNGWIKLHRKLQEKGYYKNSKYVHLWVHLLLLANHKEHEYMHDGHLIMVKEGQLITGRTQLSVATGIPETTIERILKLLENEHQIGQQKTNKYRVITILNWKEHQERTPERTTNGQQTDTYKNDKKEKNTCALEDETREEPIREEKETDEDTGTNKPAKYPHAFEVFSWFPRPQKSWMSFKSIQEREYAEYLWDRGEDVVKKALRYCEAHKDEEHFYQITKPSDLEKKWEDIRTYAKRNG